MKILSVGIGFLSAALLCGRASAAETDYAAGNTALPLQQAGGTARAMAMGSAVVAVPDGSASLLWNPAGLSRMNCTEIGFHHNSGLGDSIQEIAIFGMPLGSPKEEGACRGGGSLGGIAASLGYVNFGSFVGTDELGLPADNYHASEYSGSLGYGIELLPGLSGGIVFKADKSDLAGQNYHAYATDLGLLYALLPALDLGVVYSNVNLGNNFGGSSLAAGWRLGAAYTVNKHWLLAAAGEVQPNSTDRINLGTEYLIGNTEKKSSVLALRAGYQVNYPNPELSGFTRLTFGLGYTLTRALALDYAMVPAGELGASHRLSLTFKFDCPQKPQPPVAAAPPPPVPVAAVVAPPPERVVAPAEPEPIVAPVEPPPVVLRSILLGDSHFDFNKSVLKPEGMRVLRENMQILKDNPNSKVRIAGYTSMRGTEEYNQKLSERRAAAVEAFLVMEGGIAPERITTIGYGETHPAAYEVSAKKVDENSPAAKANMRVVFEVTVK